MNFDAHLWIAPCVQAAQFGNAASVTNGLLQASALRFANIAQKAKGIQEIRLARCIRTQQISVVPQGNICLAEVAPVLQHKSSDEHRCPLKWLANRSSCRERIAN